MEKAEVEAARVFLLGGGAVFFISVAALYFSFILTLDSHYKHICETERRAGRRLIGVQVYIYDYDIMLYEMDGHHQQVNYFMM
jgi:hypothetical protein